MAQAESIHQLNPAAGATDALIKFAGTLCYATLNEEVRYYARRHLLDTVGVMIAGAPGEIAMQAEVVIAGVRPAIARWLVPPGSSPPAPRTGRRFTFQRPPLPRS